MLADFVNSLLNETYPPTPVGPVLDVLISPDAVHQDDCITQRRLPKGKRDFIGSTYQESSCKQSSAKREKLRQTPGAFEFLQSVKHIHL